jgi:hypothetical protein
MKMMRRQMLHAVMMFVGLLRSARPTRLRKVLTFALCLTLVLVPLLGKGKSIAIPKAAAQDIILCGGNIPPLANRIIQPCFSPLAGVQANALEAEAVNELLTAHQLPSSDKNRLLGWERNLIRAQLFNKIVGYILKAPETRTASEQFFVTKLTELVKARRVLAATKAIEEYNRWASNPCAYVAPSGFSYPLHCSCVNHLCGITGGPLPPSLEEFQNYGASIAYKDFNEKPELQAISRETALAIGTLSGFAVAVGAGVVGGLIGGGAVGASLVTALFPFATTTAAAVGAVALAAAAAIVVLAIVIIIAQAVLVFTAEEIPGKLQETLTAVTNSTIDLQALIATDSGRREIYAEFLLATMPEPPNPTEVPAVDPSDSQFLLTPGDIVTPTLEYKDWDGLNRSARLSGGWFVDRAGTTGAEALKLSIKYLDWTGAKWTASRVGKLFLHVKSGDPAATPPLVNEIKYKNWSDAQFTASINNAAPTITLTSATARQGAGFIVSQVVGTIGDPDDPAASLTLSIIGDNPSNGVTFDVLRFGGELQALVTASCTAGNASFTLKVTDPGGKSATDTINVTVTSNDPPVLGYLTPPSLIVGTSLPSFNPLLPLSDPDGIFAPTVGTPTISPATFTGSVTANAAGVLSILNVGPPGNYIIKVPVSDSCTTINAELHLNVACPVVTASVSGGGYICPGGSSTVSVNVMGGTAPYTVKLSDGQTKTSSTLPITFTVSPSAQTTYTATATDAYGCPATVAGGATVLLNTLPTLSYTNKSLGVGKTALFYPSTGPGDNLGIKSIKLKSVTPSTGLSLSVNDTTGVVSVTEAAVAGTYLVEVAATNNCGETHTASFNVVVSCPMTTLSTLANGQAGMAYNQTIAASPAGAGYTFDISSGALPPGLALNRLTGAVTGTPTATGTFNLTVRATSSGGCTGTRSYSLLISCPAVTVTPTTLPAGTVGVAYIQFLTAAPAGGDYDFHVSFGSLPAGMTLNPTTGELSGTPTMKGSFYITIRARGFGMCAGARTYMFVVQ